MARPLDPGLAGLRPYRDADWDAIYDICLRTGDDGVDASDQYQDPTLLGDVYAGPYLFLEPDLAFVLDPAGAGPVGYVLGTSDTRRFVAEYGARWVPVRSRSQPPAQPATPDDELLVTYHRPERMLGPAADLYPAHLHIDILPAYQGHGGGRRLVEAFCAAAARAGAPGVHVGVSPTNTKAHGFYERVGFRRLAVDEGSATLFFGRPTTL
ncbi:MAG TPA: GNAT family N-acetyltransferase [Acidimicrobiales bacterium]|nr:GNAT family N-acetyltransferase [Acidimicrobiales bacterium]